MPVRNLLPDKTVESEREGSAEVAYGEIPAWAEDYALSLLGVHGKTVAWYARAARRYGPAGAPPRGPQRKSACSAIAWPLTSKVGCWPWCYANARP